MKITRFELRVVKKWNTIDHQCARMCRILSLKTMCSRSFRLWNCSEFEVFHRNGVRWCATCGIRHSSGICRNNCSLLICARRSKRSVVLCIFGIRFIRSWTCCSWLWSKWLTGRNSSWKRRRISSRSRRRRWLSRWHESLVHQPRKRCYPSRSTIILTRFRSLISVQASRWKLLWNCRRCFTLRCKGRICLRKNLRRSIRISWCPRMCLHLRWRTTQIRMLLFLFLLPSSSSCLRCLRISFRVRRRSCIPRKQSWTRFLKTGRLRKGS